MINNATVSNKLGASIKGEICRLMVCAGLRKDQPLIPPVVVVEPLRSDNCNNMSDQYQPSAKKTPKHYMEVFS